MQTDGLDVHTAIEWARADERRDRDVDMRRQFDQMDRIEQALLMRSHGRQHENT